MNKWMLPIGLLMTCFLSSADILAQELFLGVPEDAVVFGDHVDCSCQLAVEEGMQVQLRPPDFTQIDALDLLKVESPRRIKGGSRDSLLLGFTLVVFDTGHIMLPPCRAEVTDPDGRSQKLVSQEASILVNTPKMIEEGLAPIKDIERTPWRITDLYLVALALIAFIGFAVWYRLRHARKEATPPPVPVVITPYERAMNRLADLSVEDGSQDGVKKYLSSCSHILRSYLEEALNIPALESTTAQIGHAVRYQVDDEHVEAVLGWLRTIDSVKYAKFVPEDGLVHNAVNTTRRLITTLHEIQIQEEE